MVRTDGRTNGRTNERTDGRTRVKTICCQVWLDNIIKILLKLPIILPKLLILLLNLLFLTISVTNIRPNGTIIAITSRTNKGVSRIVPFLKEGAGVVTTRGHVHYVVTEYGIAYLYGKNLRQRAKLFIDIAHLVLKFLIAILRGKVLSILVHIF